MPDADLPIVFGCRTRICCALNGCGYALHNMMPGHSD
jgi:hypothetical protein